jgi:hypothetical protein
MVLESLLRLRVFPRCACVAALGVLLFLAGGCAGTGYTIDSETSETLADGLIHRELLLGEGPWVVHVLELDLTRGNLQIRSVHAQDRVRGRERTSDMARRLQDSLGGILAAINADFFSPDGETIGNQVSEGEVVRGTPLRSVRGDNAPRHRSHFGITVEGRPVIMRPRLTARVAVDGMEPEGLAAVNVVDRRGLVLFNHFWGDRTPVDSTSSTVMELGLRFAYASGDTTVCVLEGPIGRGGGMPLLPQGFVLAAYGDSLWDPAKAFFFGDSVRLVMRWLPVQAPLQTLVGGTPRIVLRGQNVAGQEQYREETAPAFTTDRHPRTGIGFSEDSTRVVMVTVDGRQRRSVGMSLSEFADLMIMLGVAEGLNLDGGGSTTMVVGTSVVNRPSDLTGERPVGNALVIRRR